MAKKSIYGKKIKKGEKAVLKSAKEEGKGFESEQALRFTAAAVPEFEKYKDNNDPLYKLRAYENEFHASLNTNEELGNLDQLETSQLKYDALHSNTRALELEQQALRKIERGSQAEATKAIAETAKMAQKAHIEAMRAFTDLASLGKDIESMKKKGSKRKSPRKHRITIKGGETEPELAGGKRHKKHMMGGATETELVGGATEPELVGGAVEAELAGGKRHKKHMMGGATETELVGGAAEAELAGGKRHKKHMMGGATETELVGGAAEAELEGGKRHKKHMMGGATETELVGGAAESPLAGGAATPELAGGATEPELAGGDLSGGKKRRKSRSRSPKRSPRRSRSPRSPNRWIKYLKACRKSDESLGDAMFRCAKSYKKSK